jgi:hypothetical protein
MSLTINRCQRIHTGPRRTLYWFEGAYRNQNILLEFEVLNISTLNFHRRVRIGGFDVELEGITYSSSFNDAGRLVFRTTDQAGERRCTPQEKDIIRNWRRKVLDDLSESVCGGLKSD